MIINNFQIIVFCQKQCNVLNIFSDLHLIKMKMEHEIHHPITKLLEGKIVDLRTSQLIFDILNWIVEKSLDEEGKKSLNRLIKIGWIERT